MNEDISTAITNYLSNYLMMQVNNPKRIPTLAEVNTYESCLDALKDYAKCVSTIYKSTAEDLNANRSK